MYKVLQQRCLTQKEKKMVYSIVRNEKASLWTSQLSDTQRNTKALNSYMALLPKQENTSIHNHQETQLSQSEVQWWSQCDWWVVIHPLKLLACQFKLTWFSNLAYVSMHHYISMLCQHATVHTGPIQAWEHYFGSIGYFICWTEACLQISFPSLKAAETPNVHG